MQYIDGGALQSIDTPVSLTWQVPSSLEGEELLLVVDNTNAPLGGGNGTETLRITVRLELDPPITPVISDDQMGSVSLGESLTLDAALTPNRLGQQGAFVWDVDAGVDADEDGDFTNDADATGLSVAASWEVPGTKTVTVTMTAPSGQSASSTHTVTVEDTVSPVARIQTNGTPVSNGWRVNVNDAVELTCASSTDDHFVSSCDWTVDGTSYVNTTTVQWTPDEIRSHEVVLMVKDQSGNVGNATGIINSVDPTLPTFDASTVANFPVEVTQGEAVRLEVAVSDLYDSPAALRVHWDLQPNRDTDGNGNAKDDPDKVGLNPQFTFDRTGLQEIVVTVFDASNNSDTYAFSIDVEPIPETPSYWTGGALTVIGLAMVAGLGVAGFRAVQRNRGFKLLIGRGLDEEEARTHMSMTAQRNRIGWFAKPEAYAGLDSGDVVSTEDRRAAQKQAELEAIYGGATQGADPNAGFAPSPSNLTSLSQASQSAAAEAAALLSGDLDDSVDESLQTPVQQIVGAQAALFDEPSPAATSVAMPCRLRCPIQPLNRCPPSRQRRPQRLHRPLPLHRRSAMPAMRAERCSRLTSLQASLKPWSLALRATPTKASP